MMLTAKQFGSRWPAATTSICAAWWALFVIWELLALLIVLRRLTGVFVQPLSPWAITSVFALVILLTNVLRLAFLHFAVPVNGRGFPQRSNSIYRFVRLLPVLVEPSKAPMQVVTVLLTVSGLLILGSVSLVFSPGILLLWGAFLALEALALARVSQDRTHVPRPAVARSFPTVSERITASPLLSADAESNDHVDLEEEALPEGVTQQLTRSQDGLLDNLHGLIRVEFPAGDRLQIVHVAFCPPFLHRPEVDVTQVSGSDVSLKVAQAESFGVRIEARRNQNETGPASVVLEVVASASSEE